MIRRGLASWKTQLALVAVAWRWCSHALASPNRARRRRHRGRTLDVGSTVHWLPAASAGAHSAGRSSPGLQRSARHARPGHPDAVRPVRGGASFLAKKVKDLQATYGPYQATIFAGDNIGASPLASALFHDEPTVVASNLMHVDVASVGNHEFDEGSAELLRVQNGGCHPTDGCQRPRTRWRAAGRRTSTPVPTSSTCPRTSS